MGSACTSACLTKLTIMMFHLPLSLVGYQMSLVLIPFLQLLATCSLKRSKNILFYLPWSLVPSSVQSALTFLDGSQQALFRSCSSWSFLVRHTIPPWYPLYQLPAPIVPKGPWIKVRSSTVLDAFFLSTHLEMDTWCKGTGECDEKLNWPPYLAFPWLRRVPPFWMMFIQAPFEYGPLLYLANQGSGALRLRE